MKRPRGTHPRLARALVCAGWSAIGASCLVRLSGPDAARADEASASIWEQDRLLGDFGGARTRLEDAGYKFGLQEQSEIFALLRGGLRRGATYDGLSQASVTIDTAKAFGIDGGTFYVSSEWLHGRSPTANLVGSLSPVSGIEGTRALRLYDLYYEQTVLAGAVSVRLGQFSADEEFIVSQYGALFANATFGWPLLAGADLPNSGPSFPLTTPGLRVKVKPNDSLTLAGALFNGNPAGVGSVNGQARDDANTEFRTNGGVFAVLELIYARNPGSGVGLAGTYRFGGWYISNRTDDLRRDTNGVSLASPLSNGQPRSHAGDWSIYAIADQQIWRKPGTKDQGVAVFARVMGAPGDRGIIGFYADGGVNWRGPLPGRESDVAGLAIAYAKIGSAVVGLDRDQRRLADAAIPIHDREVVIEATYSYQAAGWLMVQPDVQYVSHPGGNIPNPLNPAQRLRNAVVAGMRATVTF